MYSAITALTVINMQPYEIQLSEAHAHMYTSQWTMLSLHKHLFIQRYTKQNSTEKLF